MIKLPIVEKFYSIQGEALSIGRPAFFIRLPGCNLNCVYCDTKYACKPRETITLNDLAKEIKKVPTNLVVITGGEPLLHREQIRILTQYFIGAEFEIETNGTLTPIQFKDYEEIENNIRYNVSPKLNSSGDKEIDRIKPKILREFLEENSIFKFVVQTNKDWNEMEKLIKQIKIPSYKVWVMPEGINSKQLQKNALHLINKIKEKGYNYSPRLQIFLYGRKKGI